METKKVLGLDIGTNSIGAALINLPKNYEDYGKDGTIEWIGSRIIPETNYSKAFEIGQKSSPKNMTSAGTRRKARGSRRLKHRYKLRRTRLIKVFKSLGWIDENFPLDESRKFKQTINENGYSLKISDYLPFSNQTIFEFEKELGIEGSKSKKGKSIVPEDWIVYYLRKKALEEKITIPELVRIIYVLNQRRGFKSSRKDLKEIDVLSYNDFKKIKDDIKNPEYDNKEYETQFVSITEVISVKPLSAEKDKKGNLKYLIHVSDSRIQDFDILRKKEPDWIGKQITYLIKQKIKKGKFEQLQPQPTTDDDWALCTTALSEKIEEKHQYPGEYFYEQIKEAYKAGRNFKARQYPVYRWRYQKELEAIWKKQCELNPELKKLHSDKTTLSKLAEILYSTQAIHKMPKLAEFENKDLLHIISNDIIYYQRELKSQKNSISECRYEKRVGKEKNENGEWIESGNYGLKCIPRSSPLFQEFRIWQDIHNIRIFKKEVKIEGKTKIDVDVTPFYIDDTTKERLFDLFNSKVSISETDILKLLKGNKKENDIVIAKKDGDHSHKINLFKNRDSLKGNEMLSRYSSVFKKAEFNGESILSDKGKLLRLWHIDYSITSFDEKKSKKGITTALIKLLPDNKNKFEAIEIFCKLPELKREYGAYSACAIKKLLPVMRCGEYWNEQEISELATQRAIQIKERLDDINHSIRRLNEIADDDVQKQVLKSFIGKDKLTKGLNTYQAGYLIYDKHSEKDKTPIKSVEEFGKYIQKEIPNNSLRNPVVEKVVKETMFLVRDVWKQFGEIDEIHIELGRNLKNNSDDRKKIADAQKGNFEEKQRIKKLLYELMNDGFEQYNDEDEQEPIRLESGKFEWKTKIENTIFEVRPNPESPIDIDKFRIWRNLTSKSEFDWAKKVKDEKIPSEQEIKKYALWLSQNCRSPYTGKIIPLSKLFDKAHYEIEHVIPRSKMKNDSFNNLVISESAINPHPYKGSMLARNFIEQFGGQTLDINNRKYPILREDEYEAYCKVAFKFQKTKLKNLLATEVPDDFVERQLNDTRYIGSKLTELLAPITKNGNGIIFTGGSITSELKNNWGLNIVWKEVILPRFERLNELYQQTDEYKKKEEKLNRIFSEKNENGEIKPGNDGSPIIIIQEYKDRYARMLDRLKSKYIIHDKDEHGNPVIHLNVKENPHLNTKRIDHRHHALDALIIAATTREHIRYLNTLSAADTDDEIRKFKQSLVKGKIRDFKLPWDRFTEQAKNKLEELVVSFKTNNKIISQPKNRTEYFKINNGKIKKEFKEQKANPKWMAVRKSMFKEPQGIIYLKVIYEEKNIGKAIEIQIDRMLVQNKPEMKIASYVYDQEARKIIKDLIERIGIPIQDKEELLKEIKKFLKTYKLKNFEGTEYNSIKVASFEEYAAKRVTLDKSFDHKKIDKIPYAKVGKSVLGNLLHDHLNSDQFKDEKGNPDTAKAFNNEGLEILAKNAGKPITKVTIYEKKDESSKFGKQYVEIDAGSNAYFIMYENKQTKERLGFGSIPTHKAIERIVKDEPIMEDKEGYNKIILSPGDLVYVPTDEEREEISIVDFSNLTIGQRKRLFNVNDFSNTCYFTPNRVAKAIIPKEIDLNFDKAKNKIAGSFDTKTASLDKAQIKNVCIKLKIDRLGNISKT